MDKLAIMVREHRLDMMDALAKIENGTEGEKAKSLSLLANLLLGVSSLEFQVSEEGSEQAKAELEELLIVAQRARTVKKREKDKAYQKKKIKQVKINLNVETDADIIELLKSKDNIQGYIKEVIRKDGQENG